jgi:hypothetical protein
MSPAFGVQRGIVISSPKWGGTVDRRDAQVNERRRDDSANGLRPP